MSDNIKELKYKTALNPEKVIGLQHGPLPMEENTFCTNIIVEGGLKIEVRGDDSVRAYETLKSSIGRNIREFEHVLTLHKQQVEIPVRTTKVEKAKEEKDTNSKKVTKK